MDCIIVTEISIVKSKRYSQWFISYIEIAVVGKENNIRYVIKVIAKNKIIIWIWNTKKLFFSLKF